MKQINTPRPEERQDVPAEPDLDSVTEEIVEDATERPEDYNRETVVPEGGE